MKKWLKVILLLWIVAILFVRLVGRVTLRVKLMTNKPSTVVRQNACKLVVM
jgi:hypothetical protein